jgi:hypothetical protein
LLSPEAPPASSAKKIAGGADLFGNPVCTPLYVHVSSELSFLPKKCIEYVSLKEYGEYMGILDIVKMETLRSALGLTQEEAAQRSGLGSRQRWSDIVNGRRENLTLDTLEGIAKALGTTAKNLLK